MLQKFYIFAWVMLAGAIVLSLVNAPMSGLEMVALGLIGLALVYALLFWAVLANASDEQTE